MTPTATEMKSAIDLYELRIKQMSTQISTLNAQVASLKLTQLPTGIKTITLKGIKPTQVKFLP